MGKLEEIEKRFEDDYDEYEQEYKDVKWLISRCRELEGACNNAIRALSEVELLYTRNPVICEALDKLYAVLEYEK
jgi:hypothetical protein